MVFPKQREYHFCFIIGEGNSHEEHGIEANYGRWS
jgi:hypothetical protein